MNKEFFQKNKIILVVVAVLVLAVLVFLFNVEGRLCASFLPSESFEFYDKIQVEKCVLGETVLYKKKESQSDVGDSQRTIYYDEFGNILCGRDDFARYYEEYNYCEYLRSVDLEYECTEEEKETTITNESCETKLKKQNIDVEKCKWTKICGTERYDK